MAQDIVNENQKISYTNLDFSAIYTEVLDLIKQLTYRWDPSISDESDPGVILVKLSALIADKCNYNIDKNILETFPLSVTQEGNARQLYDQLGYYMDWYESASVPVSISWIGSTTDTSISYIIPKFTPITDSESAHIYSIIGTEGAEGVVVSNTILSTDGKAVNVVAMEGTAVQYQFENEKIITAQMVDPLSRRLYFPHSFVSQNGVFIKNTNQENYSSWKRVNNLYENSYDELRYIFGYDSNTDTCYLEFPDNYAELFGSGIEITYLVIPQETANIPAQSLNQFLAPISVGGDVEGIVLDSSNVKITNFASASGHKDVEGIDEAYINYKRTVGTFKTLITLRDYLNYIRSQELDICSNAFVCDRTNDIQCTYKIISKSHDLDTLIVKVEQIVDNTNIESTFDYKFIKSTDTSVDSGKTYYVIHDNDLSEADTSGVHNPKQENWYELESIAPKTKDALTPFSLKFYLLRKAIALNNKTAYNQTFTMMKPYPDFNSLLGDTSHLEHTYEDILSLGENTYKKSEDTSWLTNKSYWLYDEEEDIYTLIANDSAFDNPPADNSNVYEIDVEALLPHTVMFKAVYPVVMNISTFSVLDEVTQTDISSNIVASLYENVSSSQVDFGLPISVEYLVDIAKKSDDRIKNITIDPISYSLLATYYDKNEDLYIDIQVDDDMSIYTPESYRDLSNIISSSMKKDIMCKSILAGTTQLLVPDKTFIYHLSQKYISYIDNISNITGEAKIDIQNDSVTSYSVDNIESFIRKTYTLKDNETVSLYRPHFNPTKTFPNNVHFEYVLYKGISAGASYKLANNEYFILYNPIKDSDATTIIGYTVYACSAGTIIKPSFDIAPQASVSALSSFVKAKIIPYFTVNPTKNYYEISTYNENYKTEIRNSSAIINNVISGTNEISIQEIATITLDREDKYKFFWILNEPTYSNNSNLKSYTLFDTFDSVEQNMYSETINTYTLRNGEALFYTNEDSTDFAVLGPGTTLIRNCGVESSIYSEIENSLYYVNIDDIAHLISDGLFQFVTDDNQKVKPFDSGLFEVDLTNPLNPESLPADANPFALGLYEKVTHDDSSISYIITYDTKVVDGTNYYKPVFIRSLDSTSVSGKYYYVLVMRKDPGSYIKSYITDDNGVTKEVYVSDTVDTGCFKEVNLYKSSDLSNPKELGLYELATFNNNKFIDTYALNDNSSATSQNRFTATEDTSTIDRNILSGTKYSNLVLGDIGSYTTLDLSEALSVGPEALGLLSPIYKTYYIDSSGSAEAVVSYLTNPNEEGLYEKVDDNYILTSDTTPEILSIENSINIELFNERSSLYSADVSNSGFYYKPSAINTNYYYRNLNKSYLDAGVVLSEYEGAYSRSPLQYLFTLYSNTLSSADLNEADSTSQLEAIYSKWSSAVTYQYPYYPVPDYVSNNIYYYDAVVKYSSENYRCIVATSSETWDPTEWVKVDTTWVVQNFRQTTAGDPQTGRYIRVTSDSLIDKALIVRDIYPALEGETAAASNAYFYISEIWRSNFESDTGFDTNYYVPDTSNPFIKLDTDRKLAALFPNSKNNISEYGTIHIYFLPKFYLFNDFVRYTYKQYYEVKELYNRNCGEIKAWTCTALDNDYIRNDPIKNIGDLWTSLQTNTSLTLIQNDIESFSTDDTLIFEASEMSESYVNWPVFSNTECILDLDSYKVSYQRAGEDIIDLETMSVDEYKWRGYSSLILNTSSTSGQKLEYNHSLELYDSDSSVTPIAVLSGDAQTNITFQLKYPVENKSGTFIDVSTVDILGENVLNELYAFVPFANGSYYAYDTSNYSTFLYFNSDVSGEGEDISYAPQEISLPIGLPAGHYLLGMNMKDDINLTANYIKKIEEGYNIDAPAVSSETLYDDMAYTFDSSYTNLLRSYANEGKNIFTGDRYEYLMLDIDSLHSLIKLPSLITYLTDKSPYELGWYVYVNGVYRLADSTYSDKGSSLLEVVDQSMFSGASPKEKGWYELDTSTYILSNDTSINSGKTYYKEPEFYADLSTVDSSLEFEIDEDSKTVTYTVLDIFKYENNPALGEGFNDIRAKIQQLDDKEEYNYSFIPKSNDLIENPLNPKMFWNSNHVYNEFVIPQLNFDELSFRYITTKMNK